MTSNDQTGAKGPLDGVTVLDLSRFAAGPWATSLMGDMGAEVIKVESPDGGDPSRGFDEMFGENQSSYFVGMNRNKRSITLDLKQEDAKEVVRTLVARADVVIESFRNGVMERLGLGYEELSREHPRLVYCHISGYGERGPLSEEPGMDQLLQAFGGLMAVTGDPDGMPVRVGPPVTDYTTGFLTCWGVAMALLARERDGVGQRLEVNLLHSQLSLFPNFVTGVAHSGVDIGRSGHRHAHITPCQLFATADGEHVMACCLTDRAWRSLCDALGMPDLPADPRFRTNADRYRNRDVLIGMLEEATSALPTDKLVEVLKAADVPVCKMHTLAEVIQHPQVRANDMVVDWQDAEAGPLQLISAPVRMTRTPARISSGAPRLGEHTESVLAELGYSAADIARLRDGGALG